jgi:hypothetical protein
MRATFLSWLVVGVVGVVAAGCGGDEQPACLGCLSGTTCLAGADVTACGIGGGACTPCDVSQTCESGQCKIKNTCAGCLDATSTCKDGATVAACGVGGSSCVACKTGETCLNGVCQQVCNFQTCAAGCCNAGKCETSVSDTACGTKGSACTACGATQTCVLGECVDKTTDCTGCQGCCLQSSKKCMSGDKIEACGKAGVDCVTCGTDNSCVNGVCTPNPKCDATTCPQGCCSSNGVCLAFSQQTLQSCGKDGKACNVCATTATCQQGTCVENQPCFSYCKLGCCTSKGQCIAYTSQDKSTCGNSGSLCAGCGTGKNCLNGACVNDPVWDIYAVSAVVAAKKPDGSDWDGWPQSALPDPYAGFCISTGTSCSPYTSSTINNTLTPYWNEKVASWKETELITSGLQIFIIDSDNLATWNDQICNGKLPLTSADLAAGTATIKTCGSATNFQLKFVKQ